MTAEARITGPDVRVTWNLSEEIDASAVDGFRILRGATPTDLHNLSAADGEARSYVDEQAAHHPDARWYKVQAMDAEGSVLAESNPVAAR